MTETPNLTGQAKIWPLSWIRSLRHNPIILKELRGRMRSWRALFNVALYVGLLSIFATLTYAISVPRTDYYNSYYSYSYYNNDYERLGSNIFSAIIGVQLLLIVLLAPGFTSGVISGEKERQTYEILLLTLLQPAEIVFGKLLSTLAYLFLLIIAALPVESIVFLVGGVGADQLIIGLIVPLVTTLTLGTLGVMWSSLLRTSGRASRATYISMVVLVLGLPALAIPLSLLSYGFRGGSDSGDLMLYWASAFNPGVAVISTNELLISHNSRTTEHNIFYYLDNGYIYPMPWLVFLVAALVLSTIFTLLAIRFVKPLKTDGDLKFRGKKKPAK